MIQGELFSAVREVRSPLKGLSDAPAAVPNTRSVTIGTRPDLPAVIARLATISRRPRYTFMVLNLIARAAGEKGRAGPYVIEHGVAVRLRDWLCDALAPLAGRDPKRIAIIDQVREDLDRRGLLPSHPVEAARAIEDAVLSRVRAAGRCNVSRAVSELVRAGLIRRHYQGWRVDHHNRGGQREAVYTLTPEALEAFGEG